MPAGTAGMSRPGLTSQPRNVQEQIAACTHAASSGDVAGLQEALQLVSDVPAPLDSCLEALIAEAIPKGHLNILQYLATHVLPGQAPSLVSNQASHAYGRFCNEILADMSLDICK